MSFFCKSKNTIVVAVIKKMKELSTSTTAFPHKRPYL